jgi:hypothetical protein
MLVVVSGKLLANPDAVEPSTPKLFAHCASALGVEHE